MGGESIQGEIKRSVISSGKLEVLDIRDSMEQTNKFMDDGIILKEEVIFEEEKDIGGIKHSGG